MKLNNDIESDKKNYVDIINDLDIYIDVFNKLYNYYYNIAINNTQIYIPQNVGIKFILKKLKLPYYHAAFGGLVIPGGNILANAVTPFPSNTTQLNVLLKAIGNVEGGFFPPAINNDVYYNTSEYFIFSLVFMILENECNNIKLIIDKISNNNSLIIRTLTLTHVQNIKKICGNTTFIQCIFGKNKDEIFKSMEKTIENILNNVLEMFNMRNADFHNLLLKMYFSVVFDKINEYSKLGIEPNNAIYGNSYIYLNIIDNTALVNPILQLNNIRHILNNVNVHANFNQTGAPAIPVVAGGVIQIDPGRVQVANVNDTTETRINYILTTYYNINVANPNYNLLVNELTNTMTENNITELYYKFYSLKKINETFDLHNLNMIHQWVTKMFHNVGRFNGTNEQFNINILHYLLLYISDKNINKNIINIENIQKKIAGTKIKKNLNINIITTYENIFFKNYYNNIINISSKINSYLINYIRFLIVPNIGLDMISKKNVDGINIHTILSENIDELYSQKYILQNILNIIFLSIEYEKINPINNFLKNIDDIIIITISFYITTYCFILTDLIKICELIPNPLVEPLSLETINYIHEFRNNFISLNIFNEMAITLQINYLMEILYYINTSFVQTFVIIDMTAARINILHGPNIIIPNRNIPMLPVAPMMPSSYVNIINTIIHNYNIIITEKTKNLDTLIPINIKLENILLELIKQNIIQKKIYNDLSYDIKNNNIFEKIKKIDISIIKYIDNKNYKIYKENIYFVKKNLDLLPLPNLLKELFEIPNNFHTSLKIMSIISKSSIIPLTFTDLYLNMDLSNDIINIIADNINEINKLFLLIYNEKNINNLVEILIEIYYYVLDTLQYISYLKKNEHINMIDELNKLIITLTNDEMNIINDMYKAVIFNIKTNILSIISNLNGINDSFQKLYRELNNVIIILNKKITYINKIAGLHFLKEHIKDNIYLNNKISNSYENIFIKILPMLKTLPLDFVNFISFFVDINYNDKNMENMMDECNKKIYEEYMLFVSEKNYNFYLSNEKKTNDCNNGYFIHLNDKKYPNKQRILNFLKHKNIFDEKFISNKKIIQIAGMNYNSGYFGKLNNENFNNNNSLYGISKYTIDIFVYYLKHLIINNLDTNDNSFDDIILNLSQNLNMNIEFKKYIVSILFYNKCNDIISTYIKNLIHSSCIKSINGLLIKNTKYNINIENNLLLSDINYEFDLSKTYYGLQNEYYDYIEQSLNNNITTDDILKKNIIYESYSFFEENTMIQYFHVDKSLIELLMEVGCRFDLCDNSDLSPIFYSIDMLDEDTVQKIIDSNHNFKFSNIVANTRAFDFSYEMFNDFIESNNIITSTEYANIDNNIREISTKKHIFLFKTDDFFNNLLLSLDQTILDVGLPTSIENIFDMMIMLYNHQFYLYAKYRNFINGGWIKNNYNILIGIFLNNNFNIHDIGFEIPLLSYFNHHISYDQIYTNDYYINLLIDQIYDLQLQLSAINEYKVEQPTITNDINYINKKIKSLKKELEKIKTKKFNVDINNYNSINNNNKISNIFNIDKIYDIFINNTMKNNRSIGYNKIWKKYIDMNKKINNMNISNILTCFINFGYNFKNISKNDTDLIFNLYKNLVVYLLDELKSKSLLYNSNNIILTDIMNIMAHVVKYIICSKFYSSIMQIFIDDIKNKSSYDYVNIFKYIIEQNESQELKIFILENLSLKTIKYYLNVYEKNEIKIDNISDYILENIMIHVNNIDYETENELLKINITNIIQHYTIIIDIFVPKMKELMDQYNCYLMNYYKHMKILRSLY